jgi:hypothetical protein
VIAACCWSTRPVGGGCKEHTAWGVFRFVGQTGTAGRAFFALAAPVAA